MPRRFGKKSVLYLFYIVLGTVEGDFSSRNLVCILRTTTTRHMVSLIDFYFHFLANFQTLTSPNMFSIFTHVKAYVKLVRDTNSEPGSPVAIPT